MKETADILGMQNDRQIKDMRLAKGVTASGKLRDVRQVSSNMGRHQNQIRRTSNREQCRFAATVVIK